MNDGVLNSFFAINKNRTKAPLSRSPMKN